MVAEIIRTANTENVDLIAMASHGRGGLSRVFYGSVVTGVLQRIDRPLLKIRALETVAAGKHYKRSGRAGAGPAGRSVSTI